MTIIFVPIDLLNDTRVCVCVRACVRVSVCDTLPDVRYILNNACGISVLLHAL